ncbi:heme ABC exporter ATP-binding protein CcmA [Alphaproteobacteria bacterium]|nr:heme ABC exporter ATP-binding protein CcmA [Alphaproteobacteria bacterium]
MLLANNINFKRNNNKILNNISISLPPQKIIQIQGNNGVGKTTFLKILCNILEPETGSIFWNGKNIQSNPYKFYKDVTLIMDNQTSNKNLTVIENIKFWSQLFNAKIKINEINSLLEMLKLHEYRSTYARYLSFGEIKKLELLRLVIEKKKLWIMDEPFLGLDKESIELIHQTIINHSNSEGMVVLTSHSELNLPNLEILKIDKHE